MTALEDRHSAQTDMSDQVDYCPVLGMQCQGAANNFHVTSLIMLTSHGTEPPQTLLNHTNPIVSELVNVPEQLIKGPTQCMCCLALEGSKVGRRC